MRSMQAGIDWNTYTKKHDWKTGRNTNQPHQGKMAAHLIKGLPDGLGLAWQINDDGLPSEACCLSREHCCGHEPAVHAPWLSQDTA